MKFVKLLGKKKKKKKIHNLVLVKWKTKISKFST